MKSKIYRMDGGPIFCHVLPIETFCCSISFPIVIQMFCFIAEIFLIRENFLLTEPLYSFVGQDFRYISSFSKYCSVSSIFVRTFSMIRFLVSTWMAEYRRTFPSPGLVSIWCHRWWFVILGFEWHLVCCNSICWHRSITFHQNIRLGVSFMCKFECIGSPSWIILRFSGDFLLFLSQLE